MKFGYFDDNNREYVITVPETPYPWLNYLGFGEMTGIISNTGGGYCFYKDARLRRLTRYRYNNIPADMNGRYFYINDGKDIWSPSWKPAMTPLDSYECRHGLGYSRITGEKNGIKCSSLFFIPREDACEIHSLTIENTSPEKKTFRLYSFIEFALYNALDDMTNFQRNLNTAEVEVKDNVIYHKTEYRERRDHYTFYGADTPADSFETDRDSFIGRYNTISNPDAVKNEGLSNSLASGWYPIASHCFKIDLNPGEKKELNFVLGFIINNDSEKWESKNVINKKPATEMIKKYSKGKIDSEFAKVRDYYNGLFSVYKVKSNDEVLDRIVNTWNAYQTMITFNVSRSASGFESGIGRGMGFRDSNQDCMGAVSMIPSRVKERILDLAATQFSDGSAYHQYQPLTKKGNADIGGGFNDDPLWLVMAVSEYIKETGDCSILDEMVTFSDKAEEDATLFDHLTASVDFTRTHTGPHGLPLIGRADWNDCLNLNAFSTNPDESFQTCGNIDGKNAESTFIAGMYIKALPEYLQMARIGGREIDFSIYENSLNEMKNTLDKNGFDGDWFLRAYDDAGNRIGSASCDEGRIFIEPQGMCIMAGVGLEDGRAIKALDSVKKYLATEHGVKLVNPAYTAYRKELGEITSYPPGYKENAGIFTHNNSWIIIAEALAGRGNEAFNYYKSVSGPYRENISEIHRMEPYVYAQMIASNDSPRAGEAKNSWLTGAASWYYVAMTQYILGIRPDFDGLVIKPELPDAISDVSVQRKFRGVTYDITITRSGSSKGLSSSTNGVSISGNKVTDPGTNKTVSLLYGI